MSNVVIMNLLGTHQAGAGWKAFTAIFLFGWGSGVISQQGLALWTENFCCGARVRLWPKADMTVRDSDVRFRG
jgi:hypothetical protein